MVNDGPEKKVRVAIFASGRGSNAAKIFALSLQESCSYEVASIVSNKSTAGILEFAKSQNIPFQSFDRSTFYKSKSVLEYLFDKEIDLIVLAGFLWLIPSYLIDAFSQRIINIHPALLPRYGGKGMYGHFVHEAVKKNGEEKSGMTIHFVNKQYDEGNMIFQAQCQLSPDDQPDDIARRVLRLEHHFYPEVVEGIASRIRLKRS